MPTDPAPRDRQRAPRNPGVGRGSWGRSTHPLGIPGPIRPGVRGRCSSSMTIGCCGNRSTTWTTEHTYINKSLQYHDILSDLLQTIRKDRSVPTPINGTAVCPTTTRKQHDCLLPHAQTPSHDPGPGQPAALPLPLEPGAGGQRQLQQKWLKVLPPHQRHLPAAVWRAAGGDPADEPWPAALVDGQADCPGDLHRPGRRGAQAPCPRSRSWWPGGPLSQYSATWWAQPSPNQPGPGWHNDVSRWGPSPPPSLPHLLPFPSCHPGREHPRKACFQEKGLKQPLFLIVLFYLSMT